MDTLWAEAIDTRPSVFPPVRLKSTAWPGFFCLEPTADMLEPGVHAFLSTPHAGRLSLKSATDMLDPGVQADRELGEATGVSPTPIDHRQALGRRHPLVGRRLRLEWPRHQVGNLVQSLL